VLLSTQEQIVPCGHQGVDFFMAIGMVLSMPYPALQSTVIVVLLEMYANRHFCCNARCSQMIMKSVRYVCDVCFSEHVRVWLPCNKFKYS